MEAAREVRTTQIDALIKALQASSGQVQGHSHLITKSFPNQSSSILSPSQLAKITGTLVPHRSETFNAAVSSSHLTVTPRRESIPKVEDINGQISDLSQLDYQAQPVLGDLTDPRRIMPLTTKRWPSAPQHVNLYEQEEDGGMDHDEEYDVDPDEESDTDEMVIVAGSNKILSVPKASGPTPSHKQPNNATPGNLNRSGKKRKAPLDQGPARKAKR